MPASRQRSSWHDGCVGHTHDKRAGIHGGPSKTVLERRNDVLVKQGFNLTKRVTLAGAKTMQFELLVAPDDDEQIVSLWLETARGELSLRWLGPAGDVVTEWSGRSVEQRVARRLAPGKHVVELQA